MERIMSSEKGRVPLPPSPFHYSLCAPVSIYHYARRGQILFTRLRHRKIATRSLYRWHMLYNSYGASSPEPFQKLGQSLKVSRRVGNS